MPGHHEVDAPQSRPRSSRRKFSSSAEIVRGPSLPPEVHDEIKGELFFHVNFLDWEPNFQPPPTCSLFFKWWGLPPEQITTLAIPTVGYRPLNVTAIFPLKSGHKHLVRYFQDMVSLGLVVARDRKAWGGHDSAGNMVGTSSLSVQGLDERHPINASCPVYDEIQRFIGTLSVEVQIHNKKKNRKPSKGKGCGSPSNSYKATKTQWSSFSNLDDDDLLNSIEKQVLSDVSHDKSDAASADLKRPGNPISEPIQAFADSDTDPTIEHLRSTEAQDNSNSRYDQQMTSYPRSLSFLADEHAGNNALGEAWCDVGAHSTCSTDDQSPREAGSESFSDVASVEKNHLLGIDDKTAEMVSRIGRQIRKQMKFDSPENLTPLRNSSGLWSKKIEKLKSMDSSEGVVEEFSARGARLNLPEHDDNTLHLDKKAKQADTVTGLSPKVMDRVLSRWFGKTAAPSDRSGENTTKDLLNDKLDRLISDMKQAETWESTLNSPRRQKHGEGDVSPESEHQVDAFQSNLSAELTSYFHSQRLDSGKERRATRERHVQKRRRDESPLKSCQKSLGIQVNFSAMPQDRVNGLKNIASGAATDDHASGAHAEHFLEATVEDPRKASNFEGRGAILKGLRTYGGRPRTPVERSTGPTEDKATSVDNLGGTDKTDYRGQSGFHLENEERVTEEPMKAPTSEGNSVKKFVRRAAALRDAMARTCSVPLSLDVTLQKTPAVEASTVPVALQCRRVEQAKDTGPCFLGPGKWLSVGDDAGESGNHGSKQDGLLATVLKKLDNERRVYEDKERDSYFMNRMVNCLDPKLLSDAQEDPQDVAEEALLKELFFPGEESDSDCHPEKHMGHRGTEALAVEPPRQIISSAKEGPLCLAVSVENLVLLDSHARDLTACTCLLTLCFPAVKLLVADIKTSPEQIVSVSPVEKQKRELRFDHQSQFYWQLPSGESGLHAWRSQSVRVNISLKWPSSDVCRCEGSIPLETVIQSMPLSYCTGLQLVKVKEFTRAPWKDNATRPRTTHKTVARAAANCWRVAKDEIQLLDTKESFRKKKTANKLSSEVKAKPSPSTDRTPRVYACLNIGLRLFQSANPAWALPTPTLEGSHQHQGHNTDSSVPEQEQGTSWYYVSVDFFESPESDGGSNNLDLVVKLSSETVSRTPFSPPVYSQGPLTGDSVTKRHADSVIPSSGGSQVTMMFLEIWRANCGLATDGLDHLVGLIKVPLANTKNSETVAAEVYPVYNPFKDCVCGYMNVMVMRGLGPDMLKLQKTHNAASSAPTDTRDLDREERVPYMEVPSIRTSTQQRADSPNHSAMTRHVFEVKVQEALGLPDAKSLCFHGCSPTGMSFYPASGGAFIKYMFPGEEDPLFTQEVKWSRKMCFQASVRHGISLPTGWSLREHLENGGCSNLRFEIWGYFSGIWSYEPEVLQALENLDINRRSRKDVLKKARVREHANFGTEQEHQIGTAILPQQRMFDLLKEWTRAGSTGEVRRTFHIPVILEEQLQLLESEVPMLIVQIAYGRSEDEKRENLLADTIFDNSRVRSVLNRGPIEASLEISIIRAKGLQKAMEAATLHKSSVSDAFLDGVTSCVRFSLFPCNHELEQSYPPSSTPFKVAQVLDPYYGWTKRMPVFLDALVIQSLKTGNMTFEVWHSTPRAKSAHNEVWLGTASTPCLPLLRNVEGFSGWFNLLSRQGEIVGALEVDVRFTGWRPCQEPQSL